VGKEIGGKLHTGRSRNEQIATDMRLWLREELRKLEGYLGDLIKVAIGRAEREMDVLVSSISKDMAVWPGLMVCLDPWLYPSSESTACPLVALAPVPRDRLLRRTKTPP
jgi:argininosuccinate lyase